MVARARDRRVMERITNQQAPLGDPVTAEALRDVATWLGFDGNVWTYSEALQRERRAIFKRAKATR